MENFLPDAKEAARFTKRRHVEPSRKLALHIGQEIVPVSEFYEEGFAVLKRYALPKRAYVQIFDGSSSIYQGMIHYDVEELELQRFAFKRLTRISAGPAKDYVEEGEPIAGFIPKR